MTDAELMALLEGTEKKTLSEEVADKADVVKKGVMSVPSMLFGAVPAALSDDLTYSDVLKSTELPKDASTFDKYLKRFSEGATMGAAIGSAGGPMGIAGGAGVGGLFGLGAQAVEDLTGSEIAGAGVEFLAPQGLPKAVMTLTGDGFKIVDAGVVPDQSQRVVDQLAQEGITNVTRGQASGSLEAKLAEQVLKSEQPAKAGASLVEGTIAQAQQVLDRILVKSGVGDRLQVNPKVIGEKAGKAWQTFIDSSVDSFHKNMEAVYGAIPNTTINTMPLFTEVNDLMAAFKGNKQATEALSKVFDQLVVFNDKGVVEGLKPIKTEEFWQIKRSIADGLYKGSLKDNPFFAMDAGEAQKIKKRILQSIYDTVDLNIAEGSVAARELKNANEAYKSGIDKLNSLRLRPINQILGQDASELLKAEQWTELAGELKNISPEDARLFSNLMKDTDPDAYAMLQRSALDDALSPFFKETTLEGGETVRHLDLDNITPAQLRKALSESPLFRGTNEFKRINRLLTKLQPVFKGADQNLMGQQTADNLRRQMVNLLADTAGTALPRNLAYRARYAVLGAGESKRLFQAMAQDPYMLLAIIENPTAERLFVRLSKDNDGYRALSQADAKERLALQETLNRYANIGSVLQGGDELVREENEVTDQELLQMLGM